MGTKVESKSYLPGYYSMRDMNEDSNSTNCHLFYNNKSIQNGQYNDGFIPRSVTDKYDKDALKQKMLEHEAIFRNQVYELHRLYRKQRDMMEEFKRKELNNQHISIDTSSSSSFLQSQIPSFRFPNSGYTRPTATVADVINSPLSCTKGYNTTQASQVPPQSGRISKDCEILETRPLKVRKLFDLELPADEYMDIEGGQQLQDKKITDTTLKSDSCFRNSIGFTDLNAPVHIEAAAVPSSIDLPGISRHHGENKGLDIGARSKLPFLGLPGEILPNFQHGTSSNRCIKDDKGNERDWLSNISEQGTSKDLTCFPRTFQSEKLPFSSHPNRSMFNQEPARNYRNYNHQEPAIASHVSSPYLFVNSADPLSTSWSHSVSSWGNPLPSVRTQPPSNSPICWSRNPQPTHQSHEIFKTNPVFACGPATHNRFYHGFSSGSKEYSDNYPSSGFDHPNGQKRTMFLDLNYTKDMSPHSKTKLWSNETHRMNHEVVDNKDKSRDRLASLPWLRAKPVGKNEGSGTRNDPISVDICNNETPEGPKIGNAKDIPSASSVGDVDSCKSRILSFPMFENHCASENVGNDVTGEGKHRLIDINVACDSTFLEDDKNEEGLANHRYQIDLNSCMGEEEDSLAPCVVPENPKRRIAVEIDLEAPVVQESEESTLPNEVQKQPEPPVQSLQLEDAEDEFVKTAAESILAMSASTDHQHIEESFLGGPFLWFVDIVCDLDSNKQPPAVEIDYFEAMTLQLIETKEEDYMPQPFVPEIQDPELNEAGSAPGRPRRGQSRRGRQRRDFQRDILPGLISLARHEVTEDLQTFGGLMRATGYLNWQSGLAKRNGGGAGRRRRRQVTVELTPQPPAVETPPPVCTSLIEHLQNIEVGLEDRSLTGWGKTTRRPRRQRCAAAGNALAIALT